MDHGPMDPRAMKQSVRRVADVAITALAGILFVVIWFFVAYWGWITYHSERSHTENVLSRMNTAIEEEVRHLLKAVEVYAVAVDTWIAAHPERDPRSDAQLAGLVARLSEESGGVIHIRLPDVTAPLPAAGAPKRGRLLLHPPVRDGARGKWSLPVSYPLTAPRGEMSRLALSVDLEQVQTRLGEQLIFGHGSITVARSDGVVLARAPNAEKYLGKSIAAGELFRHHLSQRRKGLYETDSVIDGIPRIFAYSAMADYPAIVLASAGTSDMLADWRRDFGAVVVAALLLSGVGVYATRRIRQLLRLLETYATTDSLTGAQNRRRFLEVFAYEVERAQRYGRPLSLLAFDLDHFKQINDHYGHAAGDAVIRTFVEICRANLRAVDHLGRMGGEEFCALLPDTDAASAATVADRIRLAFAAAQVATEQGDIRFTLSAGCTDYAGVDDAVDPMLARADEALYRAKQAGRNRIALASPPALRPASSAA